MRHHCKAVGLVSQRQPIRKLLAQPEASIVVARGRPYATLVELPGGTGGETSPPLLRDYL